MSFAAATSFTAAPALAQTAAPATKPLSTTAPTAAPAKAAVDPAAAAAVRELLGAMNYRNVVQASFKQMSASLPGAIRAGAENSVRNDPRLTEEQRTKKLAELDKSVPKVVDAITRMFADPGLADEMIEAIVPVYARHYTIEEMRQLATFYKTPVGVKSLRLMPQLMAEGMQLGQQIIAPRMNKLMQELQQSEKKN